MSEIASSVVLLVEPSRARALELEASLAGEVGLRVVVVRSAAELGDKLRTEGLAAVIADPKGSLLAVQELVDVLAATASGCPVICVGDSDDEADVVLAMRAGASDYVRKSHLERLAVSVRNAIERARGRAKDTTTKAARLQAVGELAGGIAHDLNNLLAIASTFVEVATESFEAGDPALQDLVEANEALTRASALTRRVVTFLRKDRGAPKHADLNEIVRGLEGLLRCALGSRVALELALQDGLEPVLGDASELEQVVLNLVLNARDAIVERGTVRVRTSGLGTNARQTMSDAVGRRVVLTVQDDGVGMDAETQRAIFEPFFTTKANGTGLGLSNTLQIVRRHRGVVRVRSEPGAGTTMEVHLPCAARGVRTRRTPT